MRGDNEHISADALALLNHEAVKELRARMMSRCEARLRGVNTNDAEECRGAVATYQAAAAVWSMLESMARGNEVTDIKQEVV